MWPGSVNASAKMAGAWGLNPPQARGSPLVLKPPSHPPLSYWKGFLSRRTITAKGFSPAEAGGSLGPATCEVFVDVTLRDRGLAACAGPSGWPFLGPTCRKTLKFAARCAGTSGVPSKFFASSFLWPSEDRCGQRRTGRRPSCSAAPRAPCPVPSDRSIFQSGASPRSPQFSLKSAPSALWWQLLGYCIKTRLVKRFHPWGSLAPTPVRVASQWQQAILVEPLSDGSAPLSESRSAE